MPRAALRFQSLFLLVATAATATAQAERKTVSGSSVSIYNIAGRVQVEAGTGPDVIVEIERDGRDASRLTVEVGEVRGKNTLRVIYPDGDIVYRDRQRNGWGSWNSSFSVNSDGTWGGDRSWSRNRRIRVKGSGSGLEAWANLRVLVPAGKHIDVNLGVGDLTARNVAGDVRLDVASAHVSASGMRGNLTIEAGSGGIDVRDASGDEITLETGSGSVDLRDITAKRCKVDSGSGGVSGGAVSCDDIAIDVGSGSVRVEDARASRVKLETGSGGVQFGMRSSPRDLVVESGSGSVTISLPAITNAEVDIETGSGGIESDFPVQMRRVERHHLRGTIGDGSGRIRIETGSGGVRLRKM